MKFQLPLPPANRPPSSALAVPAVPVSTMLGKKAARAARMLAWLARRRSSAARRSGRLVSSADGRPAGRGRVSSC